VCENRSRNSRSLHYVCNVGGESETPRLKPEEIVLLEPLGLKAELPRMNAGAPTIALFLKPRFQTNWEVPPLLCLLVLTHALKPLRYLFSMQGDR
jgi:hypothetical protein